MDILVKAAQFFLSLSILIVLHELGHFIPAKIFKTRVEKFYLFFDPWFSIFKKKIGGTEYGMGWLPLGGYVKIAGMIDESMDTEQMKQPPQPWEFRSKPAWQRLIIMIGGVTVNVLLAIAIYAGTLAYWGEEYLPTENLPYGIWVDEVGQSVGFKNGDQIVSVDGQKVENFAKVPLEIILGAQQVEVLRNGAIETLLITDEDIKNLIQTPGFMSPRIPYIVGRFAESNTAESAGLMVGDQVVALNGNELLYFDQYKDSIPKYAGGLITLSVLREGEPLDIEVEVSDEGTIGVFPGQDSDWFETEVREYSLVEAIPGGLNKATETLSNYIRQFKIIFNPDTEAYKSVGGFITIGSQFPSTWDWRFFWNFTAFLSIMLAFLNILPIPALDGGHVVFVVWEMITGKKPPERVLEVAQMIGFVILLGLLVFANGQDILRLFNIQ